MSFLRRWFGLFASPRTKASPEGPISAQIAGAFRRWATAHGFQIRTSDALSIKGRIAGRDVTVDPGIDGEHPGWVVVTIAVALPSVTPIFVTRVTRTPDFATTRIRALFDDADIGPELRAISVGPHYVRLRLAPGAAPSIVEHAVHAVADAMRFIHAAPERPQSSKSAESEPRHSCNTTVPYPS